ncbi:hypothetical protein SAMN04488003_11373 [Loktanella fryxellensis]|uniref:Uncharacterized protein n=1 Tax=Loktanella fryxellensis TaxID=245187 RepID=A0A1H8FN89_9RHOB|nr:hypothetical protein [Loktanella fryxellensis]SEN33050.1 hypothetical protein SAMN04488003_11373 [Loktanella fryxellensis]
MTDLILTKTRMTDGVWNGVLTGHVGDTALRLVLTHHGDVCPGPTVTVLADGTWAVAAPVPAARLADGVQTFIISDAASDTVLASFAFLTGDALAEDIRAEMDLLRDELDMLKRAFRRHCAETSSDD